MTLRNLVPLFTKVFSVLSIFTLGVTSARGEIDGYVGPGIFFSSTNGADNTAPKLHYGVEFGRISRYVALDALIGTSTSYNDFGVSLKFFRFWDLMGPEQATGIMAGAGIGGIYSRTKDDTLYPSYWRPVVDPFIRGIFDTGLGFGLIGQLGVDFTPFAVVSEGRPDRSEAAQTTGVNFAFMVVAEF